MPDYPSTSQRFLKEDEGLLACNRLAVDGIASAQSAGTEQITHWDAFVMTVRDWRVWAQCILFVLVTGAQTMQYFIPTLVGTFGWTGYQGQCESNPLNLKTKTLLLPVAYILHFNYRLTFFQITQSQLMQPLLSTWLCVAY